ncbi:MAG TPA: hypothetical protein VK558_18480 [Patescibacteria group bacterium]|nr:hypothetical protein [Patescibacteria group bacterium]
MDDAAVLDMQVDFAAFPRERLIDMAEAGRSLLDCRRELGRLGRTIVAEVAGDRLEAFTHYPRGDVYDFHSHAQYYFHTHRDGEYGHFHTFLRPRGMPEGIAPADSADRRPPGDNDALSHLVAVSIDHGGAPAELFTTNRWVTAETWYRAADVSAMLPYFQIGHDRPSALANRWISALLALFRPQIEQLLVARDAHIEASRHRLAGIPVFEDRELEVTSRMAICIDRQISEIGAALDG